MDNKIKNTIALITGGASGIGKAVANRIIDNGGRVIILDLNPDGQEVAENFGLRAKFIKGDVTSEKDVNEAIDFAKKTFGGLNVLVNSAGIASPEKLFDFETSKPHSLENYMKVMNVNAFGTFNVTRLSAGIIADNVPDENNQRGVIINISSVLAFDAAEQAIAYAASKAAVAGMTLPLARTFAPKGIRVVTVAPGYINTPILMPMAMKYGSKDLHTFIDKVTLSPNRLGNPDEVAHLIQCIIENAFINAEVIRIDGGYRYTPLPLSK